MEEVRRDPKGRKLRSGGTYDSKTGRYRYQYEDTAGRRRSVYSYTLTKNDPVPQGRKQKKSGSLREREHVVQHEVISGLDSAGGKGYSTLHTLRGILRPAFAMAKRNRWTLDNPFDFPMLVRRYGGAKTRDAISRADMRRFLNFLRTDKCYSRYFNDRPELPEEQVVWNQEHTESASGFPWLDKDGRMEVAQHWQNHLRHAIDKSNRVYREPLPDITPHVCRHTLAEFSCGLPETTPSIPCPAPPRSWPRIRTTARSRRRIRTRPRTTRSESGLSYGVLP